MRTFTFFASTVVLASVASTLAAPSQLSKRAFVCPPKDDNGGALTAAGTPDVNQEVTCKYEQGGTCVYFDGNGTFSSGSSVCPNALVQGTGSSSTASAAITSTDGTTDTTTSGESTTSSSGAAASTSGAAKTTESGTTTSAADGSTSAGSSSSSSSAAGTTSTGTANGALTLTPRTWGIGAAVFALWAML